MHLKKSNIKQYIIPFPILNQTNEFQGEAAQRSDREHSQDLQNSFVSFKMGNGITHISWNTFCIRFLILLALIINISVTHQVYAEPKKRIAITQIVEHQSLDEAKRGILDTLRQNGFTEDNLEIIEKNAHSSIANALMIAKQFVSMKPDMIVTISTPSTQAVLKAANNSGIPIVFSSVTDPKAAGILSSTGEIGGATDSPLIPEELDLISVMLPEAKKIGFLYNPSEANSVKTVELMKKAIDRKFEFIESLVMDSAQAAQSMMALIDKVDLIYIPSDNTVFSALPKLVQISRNYKLPIFSSDPDSVKLGVLACVGYTQYEVGKTAGKIIVDVLSGKKNISIMNPEKAEIFINKITAELIGINLPQQSFINETNIVGEK